MKIDLNVFVVVPLDFNNYLYRFLRCLVLLSNQYNDWVIWNFNIQIKCYNSKCKKLYMNNKRYNISVNFCFSPKSCYLFTTLHLKQNWNSFIQSHKMLKILLDIWEQNKTLFQITMNCTAKTWYVRKNEKMH